MITTLEMTMSHDQHHTPRTVLATQSTTHPRIAMRRIEAACEEANNRLTAGFLRLPAHLPCDPDAYAWRNRRRASNALHYPGRNAVRFAQRALIAAIETGDRTVIEQTAVEVRALFEDERAAALTPYTIWAGGSPEPSLPEAGLLAHKEMTEALDAIAVASVRRTPGTAETARRESIEAMAVLEPFCDVARHAAMPARSRPSPAPVRAIR